MMLPPGMWFPNLKPAAWHYVEGSMNIYSIAHICPCKDLKVPLVPHTISREEKYFHLWLGLCPECRVAHWTIDDIQMYYSCFSELTMFLAVLHQLGLPHLICNSRVTLLDVAIPFDDQGKCLL